jgi:PAS domain S-box-containing protein
MSETPDHETSQSKELALLRSRVAQLERKIDQLKGQQEVIRQEEERLHAVLANMPVMIDAFDADWNIVLWNRECERVTGYSASEVVGNPKSMELLYPDAAYRETMMRQWKQRGDDYRNWCWEMTAKDGSVKSVAWSNISQRVPIAPWKTWGVGVEVTEQKGMEEALRESEGRLRDVFENLPVGIYHTSPEGRALMANPAFVRMLGYSSFAELARQNLDEISLDSKYPRREFKQRLEKEGRVVGFESAWTRRDGSRLHTLENARIVRDSRGGILYYEGTLEDISEHARMEAALRESENRYKTLVESAGESIVVADEQGVFLFMNTTAAERFGGTPDTCIGKTMWDLLPWETAEKGTQDVGAVMRTGRGMNVSAPTTLQGKTRWYNVTIEPLRDADGRVNSALIVGRDIHDLRQAQKDLEEYRDHMAHAERLAALGTLSATVAHEMNQPLTVIRLNLQNCLAQLKDPAATQHVVQDLKDCLKEVSTACSIVDRFKGFARQSSKGRPGRANLRDVAARVIRVWDDAARGRNVSLELSGLDRLGEPHVDERDIEQVFFSLVENAIQAADGKARHKLSITGAAGGESVELRFADDCGGIPQEHMDKIFDPFFTTKDDREGTGLGLCIVKDALSRAGGRIHVENHPGQGVTFIITLPLAGKKHR